jgi:nitrate/nitrite transporter NarK
MFLHTLYIVTAANFSGHYLVENYSLTAVQAGLVSSLMPLVVVFIAPVAGYVLDKFGGQLWVLLVCSIVTVIAYLLLVQVSTLASLLIVTQCVVMQPLIHSTLFQACFKWL